MLQIKIDGGMASAYSDFHDPLAIILVSSGSRGDRLLFRYPYDTDHGQEKTLQDTPTKNPYGVRISEDYQTSSPETKCTITSSTVVGYSDKVLRHLLAIKAESCSRRFAVKVNDVLFVGYPMMVQHRQVATTCFNTVIALKATSDESLVSAYQDLAKHIAIALRHEEKRCGYVSSQKALMLTIQDEAAAMTEDSLESPFGTILQKCSLAEQLKTVFDELCQCGVVNVYINTWIHINFCLPHKLHSLHLPKHTHAILRPEATEKCIEALRPYHALLLLLDEVMLNLPPDTSPSLTRLVRVASPLKSLQSLASDADLSLGQTFQLVTHLVYWSKAIVIYPLCESNVYTVNPNTNTSVNLWMVEKFAKAFGGMSLPAVLAEFSLPTPLGEHRDVLGLPQQQAQQVQMVVWMLQHRLLIQLHIYVFLLPMSNTAGATPTQHATSRTADNVFSTSLEDDLTKFAEFSVGVSEGSPEHGGTFSTYSTKSASGELTSTGARTSEEDARKEWLTREKVLMSLTPSQRQMVLNCPASSNQDDFKLFIRLCPYFNGKHHLEEIMYYENVRRSQLLMLLDKFRDILVTCQHEDPAISGLTA